MEQKLYDIKTSNQRINSNLSDNIYRANFKEIDSLEKLSDTLHNLKSQPGLTSSQAIASALSAQLRIINMINSAKLVDSSFDLIFAEFKKAVKNAAKGEERDFIREKIHIYMNSYIFFLDAKLKYSFKKDEEDAEALLEDASMLIAENSADVVMLASGGAVAKVAMKKIAVEILKKSKEKPGLIKKVLRWITKEKRQKQETENFHHTLDFLFKKLEKHKRIIGQSDITAGLVGRWIPEVHQFRMKSNRLNISGVICGLFASSIILYLYFTYVKMQTLSELSVIDPSLKILYFAIFVILCIGLAPLCSKIINSFVISYKLKKLENYFNETDFLIDEN